MEQFQAMVVREVDGEVNYAIEHITKDMLSDGEVLIQVAYSSINYKDSLAVKTRGGVIRNYPMIPGIDLSGVIVETTVPHLQVGQEVLVTGYTMGMSHTGGFAEYAQVPAEWIVPLPQNVSLRDAMVIGTAGFTAGLSVDALEKDGMKVEHQPSILVTGASGGVGSIAIQLLKATGYENISALIRKDYQRDVVTALGADYVVTLEEFEATKGKVLEKETYDYVIDTVGGEIAAQCIAKLRYGGSMTMCGNAGGIGLTTTVLPFILRGVRLLGIDSVQMPHDARLPIWHRFSNEWSIMSQAHVEEITLHEAKETLQALQEGRHLGRTIIRM